MDKSFTGSLKIPTEDVLPTCSAACPVHTDTREYVRCVSRGDYEGASYFTQGKPVSFRMRPYLPPSV